MHKLGVVVPYRDRETQLRVFLGKVPKYLKKQGIDYRIIIVEQEDLEPFNRGALLNVGAKYAASMGCDYLALHDVDFLPIDVDYSYPEEGPVELVNRVISAESKGEHLHTYLPVPDFDYTGGVVLISLEDFEKVNGYSNKYWGWGFEDNDFLLRCEEAGLNLSPRNFRHLQVTTAGLTFNGKSSYAAAEIPKRLLKSKNLSFLVNFQVLGRPVIPENVADESTVFCIPGLDFGISYTNFGTLKFEIFDNYEESYSVHTQKVPVGITNQAVITLSENLFTCYLNGVKVGVEKSREGHTFTFFSNEIHLGVSDLSRGNKANWFEGTILDLSIFNRTLSPVEIRKIFSEGSILGLGKFGPTLWYSSYLGTGEEISNFNGQDSPLYLNDCSYSIVSSQYAAFTALVPNRRKGLFREQPHETNGMLNGSWKSWNTRLNQIREQENNLLGSGKHRDGLSTLGLVVKNQSEDLNSIRALIGVNFKKRK